MIRISDDIQLIPLCLDDATDIFRILNDEREYMREWLPFVDNTHQEEDTAKAVGDMVNSSAEQFTIRYMGKLIGLIGFKDFDEVNGKIEIGYWLSQYMQGKGVMVRSVKALIDYAFEHLGVNRIQIKVAVENAKSNRIPVKLDFTLEGVERDGELLVDNKYTDLNIYSLLKKEYKKDGNN
ncbi:GNAT family protein [Massilibacteroides sp.]|uniref:GNAT family N-acetyltransferase n=1 Tax=Massilibacteroides sp. TaxID=2034766 RepID=UPI002630C9CF|nr:GNAT family protein [Massilibacteroides sp.]MDD4514250.1 GNAT family protein [Massilibacteroides sp.]